MVSRPTRDPALNHSAWPGPTAMPPAGLTGTWNIRTPPSPRRPIACREVNQTAPSGPAVRPPWAGAGTAVSDTDPSGAMRPTNAPAEKTWEPSDARASPYTRWTAAGNRMRVRVPSGVTRSAAQPPESTTIAVTPPPGPGAIGPAVRAPSWKWLHGLGGRSRTGRRSAPSVQGDAPAVAGSETGTSSASASRSLSMASRNGSP